MHHADCSNLSGEINEKEVSLDHENEPLAFLRSAPDTQNINSDGVVSFVASGETQVNSGKDVSNISNSPSYCDNKSAYSSMVGCLLACYFLPNICFRARSRG